MTAQTETVEHDIVLVEHVWIRPMMSSMSSSPWRSGGSRLRMWTCSYSSTRQSYRSLPGRRAFILSGLVDRPQQEP